MIIPKIIHQLWIGPKPAPTNMLQTWKDAHVPLGYEYILWTEEECNRRNMTFRCQKQIDQMIEINGKADIMRWEILYQYGGFFLDADSICIEPFDTYFEKCVAFATYENESIRQKLIATGTMGFVPEHALCKDIIDWICSESAESVDMLHRIRAWGSVGPGLLTRFLETGKYKDFTVFPSHCFLPIHFTGNEYTGHKKVYAFQAWGTAYNSYQDMNNIVLPTQLRDPTFYVSILIPSFNTNPFYIKECLESIKCQTGYFGIELVWINDGSDAEHTLDLENQLAEFQRRTRFCRVVYKKMDSNMGIATCLNIGVQLCSHEMIFRMDSDDIMLPDRMQCQLKFMKQNEDCVMCGTNMRSFRNENGSQLNKKTMLNDTAHPQYLTYSMYQKKPSSWFMNHPTLCFKRSAVLNVGNYDISHCESREDHGLEVRILKHYGIVYNLPEVFLLYRIHSAQVTYESNV